MIDVLGAVYDFVQAFAWRNDDVPQLKDDQIIRGWQNTGTLPQGSTEFCVITLLQSVRHGTPVNTALKDDYEYSAQYEKLKEHFISVDFCSAEPYVLPQATKLRADILEMISFSPHGVEFFQKVSPALSIMYAEGVQDLSFLDPDKVYTARYQLTLHVSELQISNFVATPSFNSVRVWTAPFASVENVDAHHRG